MASTNQKISKIADSNHGLLCEVMDHGKEHRPASYIISYEYKNGKQRNKNIVASRPACSGCGVSFARHNNLPIPPHKVTLKQKLMQVKSNGALWATSILGDEDEYVGVLRNDLCELVQLIEVTYGL